MEGFIIAIIFFASTLVYSLFASLNLGHHACAMCKQVKKGVRKRTIWIKYHDNPLATPTHIEDYYCEECANYSNNVVLPFRDDDFDDF